MPDEKWKAPLDITKEQWVMLLRDKKTITEKDLRLLKAIYGYDRCMATSPQLAASLGISHQVPVNSQAGRLGKKVLKKLNIADKWSEEYKKFNVPFEGERRKGIIYWILRPELREAMQEIEAGEANSLEMISPEESVFDDDERLYEGAKNLVHVNRYERNRGARDRCVKHYGAKCSSCQFNFEERYGEVGRDIIHVHHLKPLSDIGEQYQVDPIKDLCPVCPNCHVIIHSKNPPYSIDEVTAMIRNTRTE